MKPAVNSSNSSGVSALAGLACDIAEHNCGLNQQGVGHKTEVQKSELATRLASKIVKNSREDLLKIVADPNANEQLWLSAWQEHKESELKQRNKQASLRLAALEFLGSIWGRIKSSF